MRYVTPLLRMSRGLRHLQLSKPSQASGLGVLQYSMKVFRTQVRGEQSMVRVHDR